jgi:hypothetical protein
MKKRHPVATRIGVRRRISARAADGPPREEIRAAAE